MTTDLEQAVEALLFLDPMLTTAREAIKDVVNRNQNPGCGGDGILTGEEWQHLRSASAALQTLGFITDKFKVVPEAGMPYMGGGPALAEAPNVLGVPDGRWDRPDEPTVVSAEAEGLRVFALLTDDRVLVSKELDDKHCAELHAEQVTRLKLSGSMLVKNLGWLEYLE